MSLIAELSFPVAVTAGAITLVLSLLLPFAVRPLLVRLGIMDVPNERSSHERPVLRGLGLAVLVAMVSGGAVGVVLLRQAAEPIVGWDLLVAVVVASLLAGLLGLGEDLRGLSVKVRSVLLLALGLLTPVVLVVLFNSAPLGPSGFEGAAPLPLWVGIVLVPYALLFISSYINVANFMDGLNGISGLHGVIAGIAFALAGWFAGLPWLVVAGTVLAAGFAGFLPWNLSKPGAFLGDVGSYLLGGSVAITSFAALLAGVPVLATIGPMIIYFGDVGVTLVRRVRAGHKWDEPHKQHVYQRVQQLGYSHLQASGFTALFSAAAAALGLVSFVVAPGWWIALTVAGLALVALYIQLPRLLRHSRGAA